MSSEKLVKHVEKSPRPVLSLVVGSTALLPATNALLLLTPYSEHSASQVSLIATRLRPTSSECVISTNGSGQQYAAGPSKDNLAAVPCQM